MAQSREVVELVGGVDSVNISLKLLITLGMDAGKYDQKPIN